MFVRNVREKFVRAEITGGNATLSIAASETIIENLILAIRFPVLICTGSAREFSRLSYEDYLKTLWGKRDMMSFAVVENSPYTVPEENPTLCLYYSWILGWLMEVAANDAS